MADPDGVIVIPRNDAATILPKAKEFQEQDEKKLNLTYEGKINRDWVSKLIETKNVEIIDDVYQG